MSINLSDLLRAKSEGEKALLKEHTLESLKRVKQLMEFVKKNEMIDVFEKLGGFNNFFEALSIAVTLHDFGKIDYYFQKRMYSKNEIEKWQKLEKFLKPLRMVKFKDHEVLSAIWASLLLPNNDRWTKMIRTAILFHHYNNFYSNIQNIDLAQIVECYTDKIKKYLEFLDAKWIEIREFLKSLILYLKSEVKDEFISSSLEKIEISRSRIKGLLKLINSGVDLIEFAEFYEIDNENPNYDFLVFLGCLRRCDYSASGEVDLEKVEIELKEIYKNLKKVKEKIGTKSIWQEKLIKEIEPLKSIVLVAPTGSGKTEFALLWNAKNKRKLIYTLPLRVALNDLFRRFKNSYFGDVVDILHSTAFIEYLEEEQKGKELNVEKQLTTSELLSSPILLTTPDQIFLTSLNYYGSDKVIAVYPLSSIVVDEIQAYDPEMASIIIKTLQIVQKLGGAVLVMTATLPPYFRPFFFEDESKDYDIPEEFKLKFEEIDTRNIRDDVKNYNLRRHKIKIVDVVFKNDNKNDKYSQYLAELKKKVNDYINQYKSKNIFVVLNNVSKAIEIYKKLRDKYLNVFLLHSRLIEKEKDRRIKLIKKLIKKTKSKKDIEEIERLTSKDEIVDVSKPVIIVATQIIEASVDLDFDVMITEVSPIDSQVQRWGRIYRNRDQDYDDEQPNIVVFVGVNKNGKIEIDRGTSAIYDKRVVEKTIEVLKEYDEKLLSYDDEREMIEEVFDKETEVEDPELLKIIRGNKLKEIYIAEIKRNLDFLKYFTVEKKSQAQRLFRRIAGIQIVIPAIMEIDGDEIDKAFAKIVKNPESNKKTWKEIENEVGVNKWELKKRMYQYSINVPIFYLDDLMPMIKHEFKGFYVLLGVSDEDAKRLLKYGIEKDILRTLTRSEEEYLEDILLF